MSNKNNASKDQQDEQPALRRSSRSTRGSVKPLVNLTKEVDEDEEEGVVDEDVKQVKPSRRSSVKLESAKKSTTVKRVANKKTVTKIDSSEDKKTKVKEVKLKEEEEEEEEKEEVEELTEEMATNDGDVDAEDGELFYDLNEKEMKEINNAFDMNRLSDDEELLDGAGLRSAMRSLGFEPRGDEIKKLMKKFATKKGNKVTRDGFHRIMAFKYSTTPTMRNDRSNDEISRVFNLLDLDKTGMITLENLKSISKELNEELTQEDLCEMISEADLDGDFKINKDEFYNIMKKTSLY